MIFLRTIAKNSYGQYGRVRTGVSTKPNKAAKIAYRFTDVRNRYTVRTPVRNRTRSISGLHPFTDTTDTIFNNNSSSRYIRGNRGYYRRLLLNGKMPVRSVRAVRTMHDTEMEALA